MGSACQEAREENFSHYRAGARKARSL